MQRKQQLQDPIIFVLHNLFLFWLLIGSNAFFVTHTLHHAKHDRLSSQSSVFSLLATIENESDTIANNSRKAQRHGRIIGIVAPTHVASNVSTSTSASGSEDNKNVDSDESCDDNNEHCDEGSRDDEDRSQEETESIRAHASMLQRLKNSSSNRSRKNVSESMKRRDQRETSVGQRRTGSASRARAGSSGIGKLIGNVRTSAAAAAAMKKKKEGSGSKKVDVNKRDGDDESRASTGHSIKKGVKPQLITHMVLPSTIKRGANIIAQRLPLFRSSVVPKAQLKYYMSIDVAEKSDDASIADLRLSVFGDHDVNWKNQWINKTCKQLEKRREMGTTCLTACVNYVDANRWMIGTLECSTHEFAETELGLRRPASSIMYITEVAVSAKVRRSGAGKMLMKAVEKFAATKNVETVYLHVDTENIAAISLYLNDGYEFVDQRNRVYADFTRKLNLHVNDTMGRRYYLMQKKLKPIQTWYNTRIGSHLLP